MILIVGASGSLGRELVQRLLDRGEGVRVSTRRPETVADLAAHGADVVQGDLTDTAGWPAALRDVETLVISAHALLGRGANRSELVDGLGVTALIDAARDADVRRVVYVSVRGAGPDHPVSFCRTKHRVEEHLRASGLAFTIVRPTAFFVPHAGLVGDAVLAGKPAMLLGKGHNPRNFVAVEDVAGVLLHILADPTTLGETIDVGGPENLTNRQVAAVYGRVAGRAPKVRSLPRAVVRALATVARPFHPGVGEILSWAIYSDTVDESFDATSLLDRFPIEPTRLEDWVRRENLAAVA
jgi:uncharacterized protein YbjT (DUF2867 family)